MEVLIEVKAAMESHFELVTDERLEEVDPNTFVLSINGLVQDPQDRIEIPIRIPIRKWGVVITIKIDIGISPIPPTEEEEG